MSIFQVSVGFRELLGKIIPMSECSSCCSAQYRLHNLCISVYSNTLEFLMLQEQKEGRENSINRASSFFQLYTNLSLNQSCYLQNK